MKQLNNNTHTAVLRLFKAVLVPAHALISIQNESKAHSQWSEKRLQAHLQKTMAQGYMFDTRLDDAYITDELITLVNNSIGISGKQVNQAFHKSWQTICESSYEQLAIQQITHYITTYGFESMGIYDADSVFIPNEALEIPAINDGMTLQVIKAITTDDLLEKVITMASGIALAEQTLTDLMLIIRCLFTNNVLVTMTLADFMSKVENRELQAKLCDEFNIVPTESVAYLRHLVMTLTGESLLIKNKQLITLIKETTDKKSIKKMDKMLLKAPDELAEIFLRYKPIFLALKSVSNNKTFFNRLRKQAKTQHKPLPIDYLNNITYAIKTNTLDMVTFEKRLASASIYRKVRLANALLYRMSVAMTDSKAPVNTWNKKQPSTNSIVYRVRNGRGWATDFTWQMKYYDATEQAYDAVVKSIADDMRETVAGKTFYLPEHVNYTLPATEKQFTGEFPTGSWVAVPDDLIVGIHWQNVQQDDATTSTIKNRLKGKREYRVDLDLSLMAMSGTKIGWNASYYSQNQDLVFSGDMTDAPNPRGATELFYVQKGLKESQALMMNYFNYSAEHAVPCKLIVAHEKVKKQGKSFKQNYMVDPNNIVMQTEFHVTERQNMLGLINHVNGENRIYFANINLGTSIASYGNEHTKHAQQYLLNISENVLMLRDVIEQAGAKVVTEISSTEKLAGDKQQQMQKNTHVNTQKDKPNGMLVSLINKLVDSLVQEDVMTTTDNNIDKLTDIIDLSPANVSKTTFIELLNC